MENKNLNSDTGTRKFPLSVVVLTHNSEKKLDECLASAAWTDDVVVVDDMSADGTLDIARKYTDRIIRRKWDFEGKHRNFAYSQAKNEYVLSLDSDERVTPELAAEIRELIQKGPEFNGYDIPHRNYFGTYWIRYGGWYPNAKTKLFKKSEFKYEEEAEYHPRCLMPGKRGLLKGELIHLAIDDFTNMISKLNHMTDREAQKWLRERRKIGFWKTMRKMIHRFFKAYVLQRGYRDGWIGFMLATDSALYQLWSYTKYWELMEREKGAL